MSIDDLADLASDRPNAARMYDYYLGGYHNFAVDRQAAEQVISAVPLAREVAVANRQFLGRAVRHLAEQGVTQFLDLGSGLPTAGSVHEIARGPPRGPRRVCGYRPRGRGPQRPHHRRGARPRRGRGGRT